MSVTIKLRGNTEAYWQSANPILADREVVLSTDVINFKVGDGVSDWQSLGYWLPNDLASVIKIAAGRVGIGTSSPNYDIQIERSYPNFAITDADSPYYRTLLFELVDDVARIRATYATGGFYDFRLYQGLSPIICMSAGNVGVQKTLPTTRLDIGGGAINLREMTPPAAPAANDVRLYAKDNGSGKTQLCVKFSDGTETVLATQP